MKVRHGYVSNSSSSSFVIARGQIGDEKWEKFEKYLSENDDLCTQIHTSNYIMIETSCCGVDEEALEEMGISHKDYATYYG